jgi:hypothetical protein
MEEINISWRIIKCFEVWKKFRYSPFGRKNEFQEKYIWKIAW